MPPRAVGLKAVMYYYQSTVKVNPEGDVQLSDETIQGLGTFRSFLNTHLFGAVSRSVISPKARQEEVLAPAAIVAAPVEATPGQCGLDEDEERIFYSEVEDVTFASRLHAIRSVLTGFVPDPGYFLAGGLAGVASRTTTAPLDRLKVYLIARTDAASEAISKAKSGAPLTATKHGASTLANACRDLWAAGGIRSLFAGMLQPRIDFGPSLITAGNGINVVKVMPESAVKFGSYEVGRAVSWLI